MSSSLCNYNPLPSDLSKTTHPSVADIRHLLLIIFWSINHHYHHQDPAVLRQAHLASEAAAVGLPAVLNCHHQQTDHPVVG